MSDTEAIRTVSISNGGIERAETARLSLRTLGGQRRTPSARGAGAFLIIVILTITAAVIIEKDLADVFQLSGRLGVLLTVSGILSGLMIVMHGSRHPYSLGVVHAVFCFLFFFLAPIAQISSEQLPWVSRASVEVQTLSTAAMATNLWMLLWVLTSAITYRRLPPLPGGKMIKSKDTDIDPLRHRSPLRSEWLAPTPGRLFFWLAASGAATTVVLSVVGLDGLWLRSAMERNQEYGGAVGSAQLVAVYGLRAIPVGFAVICIWSFASRRTGASGAVAVLAVIAAIVLNFPTATPRFWAAAVLIGVLIHMGLFKRLWMFPMILIVGLGVVFPLLGASRRVNSFGDLRMTADYVDFSSHLTEGDYDAFIMVANVLEFNRLYGSTGGSQLISSLFGFVPRAVWPEKSVGSGSLISDPLRLGYDNISCPLPGEALINFGWLGLVVAAIGVAWLCVRVDRRYWADPRPMLAAVYPFALGMFFFVSRGDLMSSFTYALGCTLAVGITASRWPVLPQGDAHRRMARPFAVKASQKARPLGNSESRMPGTKR